MQNAFKEYKEDINQSLSELDSKIDRLESMIKLLVERTPQVVVPQNANTTGKNNGSKNTEEEHSNKQSAVTSNN